MFWASREKNKREGSESIRYTLAQIVWCIPREDPAFFIQKFVYYGITMNAFRHLKDNSDS